MLTTATIVRRDQRASVALPIALLAALAIAALLAIATVVLFQRRLAGALSQPLPLGLLVGVALVVATAAMAAGALAVCGASSPASAAARWLVTGSLPLLAVSLSLPQSPAIGLVALWLCVFAAEVQLWRRVGRDAPRPLPAIGRQATSPPVASDDSSLDRSLHVAALPDTNAIHQLIYRHAADRTLAVEGWLRVEFLPGERIVNAHVAFCPAFLNAPQVDVELVAGPDCTIRQALVVPWGVRWELKLAEPTAKPTWVTFEFLAAEKPHDNGHESLIIGH